MNPLNRPNDAPENPLDDMPGPLAAMNEGKGLAHNNASQKGPFSPEPDEAADEAGATTRMVPPGGSMAAGMAPSAAGTHMQNSKEGDRSYSGAEVHGKVVRPSANEKLNKLYD